MYLFCTLIYASFSLLKATTKGKECKRATTIRAISVEREMNERRKEAKKMLYKKKQRAITLQAAIEKIPILLSQYWKINDWISPQFFRYLGATIVFSWGIALKYLSNISSIEVQMAKYLVVHYSFYFLGYCDNINYRTFLYCYWYFNCCHKSWKNDNYRENKREKKLLKQYCKVWRAITKNKLAIEKGLIKCKCI